VKESSDLLGGLRVQSLQLDEVENARGQLAGFIGRTGFSPLSFDPRWLGVLHRALGHVPMLLRAQRTEETVGILPMVLVRSFIFGRFLVSLPYLNTGGVLADEREVADALIDRAVQLANELDVRFLELRHECPHTHHSLSATMTEKVHMRLNLPKTIDDLRSQLHSKVRNQVRKGESQALTIHWGREDRLTEFYGVFSRNMRDLGTPVYGQSLFREVLRAFENEAELCIVRRQERAIAGALILHGTGVTEVPSASSLREFNNTNANMLMYWHLLCRAVERGQRVFDFGRSSLDTGTYRFKEQWGARPYPAAWQYHVRRGQANEMRPTNDRYQRMIRIWRRLPVPLTRLIGPRIMRAIP
jgi:FemAB-related protein (PEP-CTERM system-associated)